MSKFHYTEAKDFQGGGGVSVMDFKYLYYTADNRACNFKQLVSQSKFSWIRKITLEISVV